MEDQNKLKGIFYTGDLRMSYIGSILAEITKDRLYSPFIEGSKDLTIIDAGAHIGIFSHYVQPYAKIVHAIEPAMEHFTVLTQMIAFNGFDNIIPHNVALANKSGSQDLFHWPNKTSYSLYGTTKITEKEKVNTIDIESFMVQNKIDYVDFLKLDVEGMEFEILGGKSFKNVSKRIKNLVVEYHIVSGRHPNQLYDALSDNGYKVAALKSDAKILFATR